MKWWSMQIEIYCLNLTSLSVVIWTFLYIHKGSHYSQAIAFLPKSVTVFPRWSDFGYVLLAFVVGIKYKHNSGFRWTWKTLTNDRTPEKYWNFVIFNKNPEKWYGTWKNLVGLQYSRFAACLGIVTMQNLNCWNCSKIWIKVEKASSVQSTW